MSPVCDIFLNFFIGWNYQRGSVDQWKEHPINFSVTLLALDMFTFPSVRKE